MNQQDLSSTDPEQLQKELIGSFTKFENSFRKRYPVLWTVTLIAPVVVSAAALLFIGLVYDWSFAGRFVTHAVLTFFVFGRFIILSGGEDAYRVLMSPAELFGLVTYLDFMTALFVTFHMGILFRLPWLGPKIATLVWDGKFVMDSQPWIKRFAFAGLVAFVMFPSSTTGSIGGSIFGRLLGLSRFATVGGVLVGSILGNAVMFVLSSQLNQYLNKDNIWLKVVGALLIVVLCIAVEWRYRQVKKKILAKAEDADSQIDADLTDAGKANPDRVDSDQE